MKQKQVMVCVSKYVITFNISWEGREVNEKEDKTLASGTVACENLNLCTNAKK